MSIRALALELYAAQQEVERLEGERALRLPAEPEDLKEALRQARAELQRLRRVLEGAKERARS